MQFYRCDRTQKELFKTYKERNWLINLTYFIIVKYLDLYLPFKKVVVIIFFHICHGVVRNISYFVKDVNNSIQSCVPDFIVFEVLVILTSDLRSPISIDEGLKTF